MTPCLISMLCFQNQYLSWLSSILLVPITETFYLQTYPKMTPKAFLSTTSWPQAFAAQTFNKILLEQPQSPSYSTSHGLPSFSATETLKVLRVQYYLALRHRIINDRTHCLMLSSIFLQLDY